MSWTSKRDSVCKYLQSVQYGTHGNFSRLSYPTFFPRFESQDIAPPDDFVTSDEELDCVLFGTLRGQVVGLRYYTGVVNNNEMVSLQREPNNPYDKNAIKVNNVNGNQVGHLKRNLAAALAFLMDNKLVQVEGVVPFGANNAFTMPLHMTFWGKEENRKVVLDQLKKHGFKLGSTLKDLGLSLENSLVSGRAGPRYNRPAHVAVQMTAEQLKTEFDKLFEDLKEDAKTNEMEPAEAVGTPLLPHQKQALSWMILRENSKELPPFWEQRNDLYYNTITNFSVKQRPENVLGGILADDMGLGKTLTAIAVILTNFADGQPLLSNRSEKNHPRKEYKDETVKLRGSNTNNEADGLSTEPSRCGGESVISDIQATHKFLISEVSSFCPKRRKISVEYTESSDLEKIETSELAKKMKGSSKVKEDTTFAHALTSSAPVTKKKILKKGASVMEGLKKFDTGERSRATLIICPLSVLSNWIKLPLGKPLTTLLYVLELQFFSPHAGEYFALFKMLPGVTVYRKYCEFQDQFGQHIKSEVDLNFYVYYGPDRIRDPTLLSEQDIVLTTYNILTHDYGTKDDSPLHSIKWLRVILDEGHTIRNPNAQQTKAALDLEAERRWVLTGTPIQNSLNDLWSLLSFLKLKPFIDREWWQRTIQRPVTTGDEGGLRRLRSLIKSITLRRTKTSKIKGKPVLELPERKVFIQHVSLSEEERKIYQSVKNEGKAIIGRYFTEGTVLAHYADVLGLLLRLRQICCHTHLLTNSISSNGPSGNDTPEELRKMLIRKMKLILSSGSDEECAVCLDSLTFPVITHCAHVFCKPCICQVIQNEQPHAKCPLCRNNIHGDNLLECPPEESACDSEKKSNMEWTSSSKINALMHALIELRTKNPNIKSLVVSQFTTFLSLIETPLKASGFIFTRLDGSMTQKKRVESIQCFQNTEAGSPTIMLLSLKAGGVGLNLCAASRVFLMDPAWNPAAEDQCFDRCHRLGQKQEVIITKFIVKDSVEENMLKIQNTKRELAAGAFGTKKPDANEMKQAKINEIRTLVDL
ncbi:helicase-like transcription factor isoform X1 [Arvicola amphibius]|uniref:helicase-like transcription factor isoform X1 n=1 Tax=Arvicola amphibius TaxID=1047088 RepID=UPI0018E35787|nr:helicase-like transcription factor isoform X1 [Arvicola amphibius]